MDTCIDTPYESQTLIYADCTGSGEVDTELDTLISRKVLPYYANIHSDSFCSHVMTSMITKSRETIKRACVRDIDEYACIFTGQGMTGATRHLTHLVHRNVIAIVYTALEHLSNSSLWEEVFPDASVHVVSIESSKIDYRQLSKKLNDIIMNTTVTKEEGTVIVSFTACSNVLGCIQPVQKIIERVDRLKEQASEKKLSILTCVDCAACSPYIPLINLCNGCDAIVLSPHKFKGGQCTPGVLVVKRRIIKNEVPFFPGGGTIWYKEKKESNHFLTDIEHREEGGTPNIIGMIRTGLLFARKASKQKYILERMLEIVTLVDNFFCDKPELTQHLEIFTEIGQHQNRRLPIYSFSVEDVHPGLFVKLLSDRYGIQARSGVSCCYLLAEELCDLKKRERKQILEGKGTPNTYGWIRISFYYEFDDSKVTHILNCIEDLVNNIDEYRTDYKYNSSDNIWYHKHRDVIERVIPKIVNTLFKETMTSEYC